MDQETWYDGKIVQHTLPSVVSRQKSLGEFQGETRLKNW